MRRMGNGRAKIKEKGEGGTFKPPDL